MTRAQVRNLACLSTDHQPARSGSGYSARPAAGAGTGAFQCAVLDVEFRTLVLPLGSVVLASVIGIGVSLLAGWLPAGSLADAAAVGAAGR